MAKTIYIVGRGDTLRVNDRDQITSGVWHIPSDTWKMLGAVEYKCVYGRNVAIRHYSMADVRDGIVPWLYKNGKQRCYIVDLDHNSRRVWMSPTGYSTRTISN